MWGKSIVLPVFQGLIGSTCPAPPPVRSLAHERACHIQRTTGHNRIPRLELQLQLLFGFDLFGYPIDRRLHGEGSPEVTLRHPDFLTIPIENRNGFDDSAQSDHLHFFSPWNHPGVTMTPIFAIALPGIIWRVLNIFELLSRIFCRRKRDSNDRSLSLREWRE